MDEELKHKQWCRVSRGKKKKQAKREKEEICDFYPPVKKKKKAGSLEGEHERRKKKKERKRTRRRKQTVIIIVKTETESTGEKGKRWDGTVDWAQSLLDLLDTREADKRRKEEDVSFDVCWNKTKKKRKEKKKWQRKLFFFSSSMFMCFSTNVLDGWQTPHRKSIVS